MDLKHYYCKKKMKYITLLSLCFCHFTIFGQEITLKNNLGEYILNTDGYYEVYAGEVSEKDGQPCCQGTRVWGYINQETSDSIGINAKNVVIYQNIDEVELTTITNPTKDYSHMMVSKNDIYSITYFKSEKHKKRKSAFIGVGISLLFTGIVTAANYFVVSKSDNRRNLLYSGAAQFGIGVGFLIAAKRKQYKFKDADNPWRFK